MRSSLARAGAAMACCLLLAGAAACSRPSRPQFSPAPSSTGVSPAPSASLAVPSLPPSASPSAGPTPSATHALTESQCLTSTIASMSTAEKVGQLIMVGTSITDISEVDSRVTKYHIGNVFLAGRSSMSASSLRSAVAALQRLSAAGIRLNIALDQEGGEVQTLKSGSFPAFPTAVTQGTWSQAKLKSETADWAKRLADAGITMDLAPVADTVPSDNLNDNPPIAGYDREYGTDPAKIAADITTIVDAAQAAGLTTTLKHFPGLGRVHTNTDVAGGAVDDVATTSDPYLQPFRAGIQAGTGAVMMSLASYPKLDPDNIAALSTKIITDELRHQLGFTGVVISDDMGNAGAVKSIPAGERAIRFINAGGDIVLTVNGPDAATMATAMVTEAGTSSAFATKVNAAVRTVLTGKYSAGLLTCAPSKA